MVVIRLTCTEGKAANSPVPRGGLAAESMILGVYLGFSVGFRVLEFRAWSIGFWVIIEFRG